MSRYFVPNDTIETYRRHVRQFYSQARRALMQARVLLQAGLPADAGAAIRGARQLRGYARHARRSHLDAEENNRLCRVRSRCPMCGK